MYNVTNKFASDPGFRVYRASIDQLSAGVTMKGLDPQFRSATGNDAAEMAELVISAGDGLPLYLWAKKARPGQSARDVGRERARHGVGGFAWSNTVIRESDGKMAACLIGYPLDDEPGPPGEKSSAILLPLLELEKLVPGSWYINVLATCPEHRGNSSNDG